MLIVFKEWLKDKKSLFTLFLTALIVIAINICNAEIIKLGGAYASMNK